jgi:calcineurin-like phosphoesterase family protein
MYKQYKFKHNKETKCWWIADTHFCHDRPFILDKRGYDTITDHDEYLIMDWNDKASVNDTIFHGGDFLLGAGQKSREVAEEIIGRLNGNIQFIWGNHNAGVKSIYQDYVEKMFPSDQDIDEVYPLSFKTPNGTFTYYGHYLLANIEVTKDNGKTFKQMIFHSHYAHRLWIDSHKGKVWNVSGHSHGSDPERQPEYPFGKCVDVGVENFGGLVSFEELDAVMAKKSTVIIDHHDSATRPSMFAE